MPSIYSSARTELAKLLIYGLFRKIRILAQDGVNNHAHVLDGLNEDYLRYLELFINATDLKPFVTGTAQPKMNQAKMNSIPVALPPLAEQSRIVAKVDALMALCDRLEASLGAADTTSHRLLESLLQGALEHAANELEAVE